MAYPKIHSVDAPAFFVVKHKKTQVNCMAIPASRTKIKAEIGINEEQCTGCGLCVSVCKDYSLKIETGRR
jgi:NAD-dependent dihydropyrimidine dehydrogenase PreA subunit